MALDVYLFVFIPVLFIVFSRPVSLSFEISVKTFYTGIVGEILFILNN